MCQEIWAKDKKIRITTSRQLAEYLGIKCTVKEFQRGLDKRQLKELKEMQFDWRDCCLCGVDIESICKKAGKKVRWDDDPMCLLVEE